jgi:hypothetical protein
LSANWVATEGWNVEDAEEGQYRQAGQYVISCKKALLLHLSLNLLGSAYVPEYGLSLGVIILLGYAIKFGRYYIKDRVICQDNIAITERDVLGGARIGRGEI